MKVMALDISDGPGLLHGFALGSLAMGQLRHGIAFRERPFPTAIGVDEQEFERGTTASIADSSYLQRQVRLG